MSAIVGTSMVVIVSRGAARRRSRAASMAWQSRRFPGVQSENSVPLCNLCVDLQLVWLSEDQRANRWVAPAPVLTNRYSGLAAAQF